MDDKERQAIIDSIFPIGQERWIKVKYLDYEKSREAFWMTMNDDKRRHERGLIKGYEVTAIGVRDEYTPQISALMDLKADIIGALYGLVPDYILEELNNKFKNKIEELQRHTIKHTENENPS